MPANSSKQSRTSRNAKYLKTGIMIGEQDAKSKKPYHEALWRLFHFDAIRRNFIQNYQGKTRQKAILAWEKAQLSQVEKGIVMQFE